jgi:predicted GNAT family N-acyltransferase
LDGEGNIVKPKQSVTRSTPIGTIRLVPFPHAPHPEPGSVFSFDATVGQDEPLGYIVDRATTYHNGKEPYIKLGRLSVIKEFRGNGIAKVLANTALSWAHENPTYFNPSVSTMGMEKLGAANLEEVPVWKGLTCVHAQEQVVKFWANSGFKVDEGMGEWVEEGLPHVGMFMRLNIENKTP